MVSAREGNMKRKNGNNKGGIMRKNFKQGPQFQQQQQQRIGGGFKQQLQLHQQRNMGRPNMGAMFNQNPMMDNPNQMMDNPGYMDFNEPPARPLYQQKSIGNKNQQQMGGNLGNSLGLGGIGIGNGNANGNADANANANANGNANANANANDKGNKNRGRRINVKQQQQQRNGGQRIPNQRNGGNNANGRWPAQQRNNQNGNFGMNRGQFGPMQPPLQPPMGRMHPGDFDYGRQFFGPQRFAPGPGPMMPMMGPPRPMQMMGPPMPIGRLPALPPFRARNAGGRGGNANRGVGGPIRRKGQQQQGNNCRVNPKAGKNKKKGERKAGKKPMTNAEKYPLDKPWVTDEIKAAHDKKVELSNQLKGKKDDVLFAEFKKQRDAFVTLYEAARTEHNAKNKPEDVEKNETDKTNDENATNATTTTNNTATPAATTTITNTTANSNDGGGQNVVAQETAN